MTKTIEEKPVTIKVVALIALILFFIAQTSVIVAWKTEKDAEQSQLDDRIIHIGEKVIDMRSDINTLKDQASGRDIQLAQINTKLANIELLLIEIKQDIKEQR